MYCIKQDLINRGWERELIQRTDKNFIGVIDNVILNQAINDAQATIDVYLQARYSLPLAQPVEVLTRLACDLVHYFLFDDAEPTDTIQKRYDVAIRMLEQISKGTVLLGVPTVTVSTSSVLISSESASDWSGF